MTIFEEILQAGIPYDNHESDLYIPVNGATTEILQKYPNIYYRTFNNRLNGNLWYDVAFMYDPFWKNKEGK